MPARKKATKRKSTKRRGGAMASNDIMVTVPAGGGPLGWLAGIAHKQVKKHKLISRGLDAAGFNRLGSIAHTMGYGTRKKAQPKGNGIFSTIGGIADGVGSLFGFGAGRSRGVRRGRGGAESVGLAVMNPPYQTNAVLKF
jgi:hypothetical protein